MLIMSADAYMYICVVCFVAEDQVDARFVGRVPLTPSTTFVEQHPYLVS